MLHKLALTNHCPLKVAARMTAECIKHSIFLTYYYCFDLKALANNTLDKAEEAENYLHTKSTENINKVSIDVCIITLLTTKSKVYIGYNFYYDCGTVNKIYRANKKLGSCSRRKKK